jgi:hypothetical protein
VVEGAVDIGDGRVSRDFSARRGLALATRPALRACRVSDSLGKSRTISGERPGLPHRPQGPCRAPKGRNFSFLTYAA